MSKNSFLRYSLLNDDSDDEDGNITGMGTICSIFENAMNSSLSYGMILVGEVSDFRTKAQITFALSDFQDDAHYLQKGYEVHFRFVSEIDIPYLAVTMGLSSSPCLIAKSVNLTGKMKSLLSSNASTAPKLSQNDNSLKGKVASDLIDIVDEEEVADEEVEDGLVDYDQYRPLSGTHANVHWRAVSMDELRLHPLYTPLPELNKVHIDTASDLTMFRQDSWQWNVLHQGRLTTSRAAACLGFYEEQASKVLGIPKSLVGHQRVLEAWNQLLTDPVTDYSIFNDKQCNDDTVVVGSSNDSQPSMETDQQTHSSTATPAPSSTSSKVWQLNKNFRYPSPAAASMLSNSSASANVVKPTIRGSSRYSYHPRRYSHSQQQQRRSAYTSALSARLAWGSAQEATAVLAALNYFDIASNGTSSVLECGLLPLEALSTSEYEQYLQSSRYTTASNQASSSGMSVMPLLPLLGASPDGIVLHSDGSKEVLEIKCSSPFENDRASSKSGSKSKSARTSNSNNGHNKNNKVKMHITDRSPPMGVPAWHIPQLQLEILCAGAQCTGAVLVSLSALNGAVLYRVPRDEKYIVHMLRLFQAFRHHYGSPASPPPINFMSSTTEMKKLNFFYFYERTLHIARNAEVVTTIKQNEIQRSPYNKQFFF